MSKTVAIFDYGSGNLRSALRAVQRAGADASLTCDLDEARQADGLVVPGVGAFTACMKGIRDTGLDKVILQRVASSSPVLGICVGMQVLFERGREHGIDTEGLGIFAGTVDSLQAPRVPHMGWNTVEPDADMSLFAGIEPDTRFYFVHSYAAVPPVAGARIARGHHGHAFVAAIERDAVSACQFHPEKSSDAGAAVLANWIKGIT
ncbi:imidazole glycerol phosphate synthase subunit HisH [Natronoglycomyces albus]|uniref:Imidazole glycerol phosphate synthase subunit HisH n=1 Tax=Natronoglycomyces albus TaxID=2811108 RepID=A0A895XLE4_9ACTN|nr:imidazole glycerol phosphate synthase subunit HisH [Natronoglycomyces albus]QSB04239.1 imidazole glycerol phosphate synthase subunit HisH [Natronoglycomyces albus]